ncbi:TlpA family protein disulfide reductase [Rossellomorea vietnamensis]|uniref:TlpA family protein disulfide reductase n=1 Tax=Rossellomorea vietnamensis TaxID=218284 RepID=A0A5D4NM46_9BACI|nr:TlpA disulfide reductase family protein [Rossellomorea vietnamensis]TYS15217.1 TlpA family protein disulfide reductase [Rossellomorea vietnamensis]
MNKRILGIGLIAVLVGLFVVNIIQNQASQKKMEEQVAEQLESGLDVGIGSEGLGLGEGDKAPDFTLTTLDGREVSLSDFEGQKVILNFWATWCPPCKAEMPHMQEYYGQYHEKANVEMLAVNLTTIDNGKEAIEKFAGEYGLTFPIPLDEDGVQGTVYQAQTIPTSYMIDTDGIIRHKILGPMNKEMMIQLVENMD